MKHCQRGCRTASVRRPAGVAAPRSRAAGGTSRCLWLWSWRGRRSSRRCRSSGCRSPEAAALWRMSGGTSLVMLEVLTVSDVVMFVQEKSVPTLCQMRFARSLKLPGELQEELGEWWRKERFSFQTCMLQEIL